MTCFSTHRSPPTMIRESLLNDGKPNQFDKTWRVTAFASPKTGQLLVRNCQEKQSYSHYA